MMTAYKLMPVNPQTGQTEVVQRLPENYYIPFDPANRDYQVYLKWLAEGNEPLPADE
jgi:hypothetical protein